MSGRTWYSSLARGCVDGWRSRACGRENQPIWARRPEGRRPRLKVRAPSVSRARGGQHTLPRRPPGCTSSSRPTCPATPWAVGVGARLMLAKTTLPLVPLGVNVVRKKHVLSGLFRALAWHARLLLARRSVPPAARCPRQAACLTMSSGVRSGNVTTFSSVDVIIGGHDSTTGHNLVSSRVFRGLACHACGSCTAHIQTQAVQNEYGKEVGKGDGRACGCVAGPKRQETYSHDEGWGRGLWATGWRPR